MARGQHYTNTFREKVLSDLQASGDSVTEVAKRHGVSKSNLYMWKKKTGARKGAAPVLHEDSQVGRLREALRREVIARALAEYKAKTGVDLGDA